MSHIFSLNWCCAMPGSPEEQPAFIVATLRTPRSMVGGGRGVLRLDLLFFEEITDFFLKPLAGSTVHAVGIAVGPVRSSTLSEGISIFLGPGFRFLSPDEQGP